MATPAAASTLALYRDDGPLARGLGRTARPRLRFPTDPLLVLAALPLALVLALEGDGVSDPVLGGGIACLVLLGALSCARPHGGRLAWATPPLLRLLEYGSLIALALLADDSALPACFAFLAAVAFRHYDGVYRMRHQGAPAAAWVRDLGGGWEGRVLLAYVLFAAGVLTEGLYVAAGLLAIVSVAESVTSWLRFSRASRPAMYADEEDEDD